MKRSTLRHILKLATSVGIIALALALMLSGCSKKKKKNGAQSPLTDTPSADTEQACAHEVGAWEVVTEPACERDGWRIAKCKKCDVSMNEGIVAALGHEEGYWIVDKEPTQTEDGKHHTECNRCHVVITSELMPSFDSSHEHVAGEWIEVSKHTCTEDGYREQRCTECDAVIRTETIKAAHALGDWIIDSDPGIGVDGKQHADCKVCGERIEQILPGFES